MLAAFKRIMSMTDSKTAWIQVACYLLGYGCFAIPAALFIKRYTYKSGVMLGLGLFAVGTFMFYPAMLTSGFNINIGFLMFLLAILILFAGLSFLETSANSYVCAIGPQETATQRLNFAQSFNPFGAISGVVISQVFILSQLNTMSEQARAALPPEQLDSDTSKRIECCNDDLYRCWAGNGFFFCCPFISQKCPTLKKMIKGLTFWGTFKRLFKNRNYVWAVIAQFFYVGAQIAVWSFIIRYTMQQLQFDAIIAGLGGNASCAEIIDKLRSVEPVAAGFYNICEAIGLQALLPRTPEQAGATYYIISLISFVIARFLCTGLMKYIKPRKLLDYPGIARRSYVVYLPFTEMVLSAFMHWLEFQHVCHLCFQRFMGLGISGLGEDTKIGGAGMVMAIAGAAVLTQIQGIVSDQAGSIQFAYWVPAIAFLVVAFYSSVICRKQFS